MSNLTRKLNELNRRIASLEMSQDELDVINKGVKMYDLFQSDIMNYHFDFDEWPATSLNHDTVMRSFSGSLFSLRYSF